MKLQVLEAAGYQIRRWPTDRNHHYFVPPGGRQGSGRMREPGQEVAIERAWAHLCENSGVYRHKKGGIYQVLMEGKETDGCSEVVIYKHLAPHEPRVWVRNKAEFYEPGRFERLKA
jgi:hypothetical protein